VFIRSRTILAFTVSYLLASFDRSLDHSPRLILHFHRVSGERTHSTSLERKSSRLFRLTSRRNGCCDIQTLAQNSRQDSRLYRNFEETSAKPYICAVVPLPARLSTRGLPGCPPCRQPHIGQWSAVQLTPASEILHVSALLCRTRSDPRTKFALKQIVGLLGQFRHLQRGMDSTTLTGRSEGSNTASCMRN